jgi:hypothetical protein
VGLEVLDDGLAEPAEVKPVLLLEVKLKPSVNIITFFPSVIRLVLKNFLQS